MPKTIDTSCSKYPIAHGQDMDWGLVITNTGHQNIEANTSYPSTWASTSRSPIFLLVMTDSSGWESSSQNNPDGLFFCPLMIDVMKKINRKRILK